MQKLLDALVDAGFGTAALTSVKDVLAHEITIFQDYVQVDVQTFTPGIKFTETWDKRETFNYQGQVFYIVCKADLNASKQAAGGVKNIIMCC
ncbi:hypothetical protein JW935_22360 [candidate division KSB1 bacterium]|nr:hypothetical protein [candidate division KSB1 bacterium]